MFGMNSQHEICMAMLMYYPAQENVFRSICEPDNLLVSACTEKYNQLALQGEEDIGRIFGQDRFIYGKVFYILSSFLYIAFYSGLICIHMVFKCSPNQASNDIPSDNCTFFSRCFESG
jgi:hypothetical protein